MTCSYFIFRKRHNISSKRAFICAALLFCWMFPFFAVATSFLLSCFAVFHMLFCGADDLLVSLSMIKAYGYLILTHLFSLLFRCRRGHKFLRLDGQTDLADRRDMVSDFQRKTDYFVFILSTRAGGLGINLTAVSIRCFSLLFFSCSFVLAHALVLLFIMCSSFFICSCQCVLVRVVPICARSGVL